MLRKFIGAALMIAALAWAGPAAAQTASAVMKNPQGTIVGKITLTQTPRGVLISTNLVNLPDGAYAVIHNRNTPQVFFPPAMRTFRVGLI
jgi:Cu/Zn superoxide dismutase